MADFTQAQRKAIDTRDKTILVSAAAGSGKTTTLTERIIQLLTDKENPADIGRFLIVTFTNASAADLRSKITKAVSAELAKDPSNRHLNRQLLQLGRAHISTIDSFYYDVVKENFQALGVGASSRIIDQNQRAVIMNEILSSLISERYEQSSDFALAMDCFLDSRGSSSAEKELISLYEKLSGYPEFLIFLKNDAETLERECDAPYFESRSGKAARQFCLDCLDYVTSALSDLCDEAKDSDYACYYPSVLYDFDHMNEVKAAVLAGDYGKTFKLFNSYAKVNYGRIENGKKSDESELFKKKHEKLRKTYTDLFDKYFSQSEAACIEILRRNAHFCREIYGLLTEFDSRFSEKKRSLGVLDFTDNKRMTLDLFVKGEQTTEYAKEFAQRFDAIYIDEYQDTDLVQDTIFRTISRPDNRFMVGDIKQSIYRFRGANPTGFANYKNTFPDVDTADGDECAIYMSDNFRCDEGVVKLTNAVSDFIFTKGENSIGYVESDRLGFSKRIEPEGREQKKAEFVMIRAYQSNTKVFKADPEHFGGKGVEHEARYTAAKICELLRGEEYCEDHGVLRRIEAKDIAILARTKKVARVYAEALEKVNVPCSVLDAESYFDNPEVLLAICLLNVIDNPQKDVYLAGLLRSPLYGFNLDELAKIRKRGTRGLSLYDNLCEAAEREEGETTEKIRYFLDKLSLYREQARVLPVDRLLRYLYFDTDMLSFATPGEGDDNYGVRERRANLLVLYEYARSFESGSFKGLYSFICFIRDTIEAKQTVEPAGRSGDSNMVRIMTIHSSKGLEFPVCFLTSCGRSMHSADTSAVAFSREIGVSATFRDKTGLAILKNPVIEAIRQQNLLEDSEEEMRVLYVALTRARERLFLVGSFYGDARYRTIEALVSSPHKYSVMNAPNWDAWISAAIEGREDVCDMKVLEPNEVVQAEPMDRGEQQGEAATEEDIAKCEELFRERFGFAYDDRHVGVPAKLSVSRLYPGVLDSAEQESEDRRIEIPEIKNAPAFLLEEEHRASGAERGTATHAFMQFCDFANAQKNGARAEAQRLAAKGFIPAESLRLINFRQLERFFDSGFFASLSGAKKVWREQRFNLLLPASKFTEDEAVASSLGDTKLAVQGVIDLVYEDAEGNLILADYKTDYLTPVEIENPALAIVKLTERHGEQLSYYREAVRQIFGREPTRVCIYSLPLGEALDIETKEI